MRLPRHQRRGAISRRESWKAAQQQTKEKSKNPHAAIRMRRNGAEWQDGGFEERKRFFFEKKKQKTFVYWGLWRGGANARRSKSFLLLFLKKEALFYLNPSD
jgi:hypothetical protein